MLKVNFTLSPVCFLLLQINQTKPETVRLELVVLRCRNLKAAIKLLSDGSKSCKTLDTLSAQTVTTELYCLYVLPLTWLPLLVFLFFHPTLIVKGRDIPVNVPQINQTISFKSKGLLWPSGLQIDYASHFDITSRL